MVDALTARKSALLKYVHVLYIIWVDIYFFSFCFFLFLYCLKKKD